MPEDHLNLRTDTMIFFRQTDMRSYTHWRW